MKYNVTGVLGLLEPADGFTDEEKELTRLLGEATIQQMYNKLPTSRMKFIVAAHFELGYSQELLAEMLGIKQASLNEEIQLIKKVLLGRPYRPHKPKGTIKVEDVFKMMMCLKQP